MLKSFFTGDLLNVSIPLISYYLSIFMVVYKAGSVYIIYKETMKCQTKFINIFMS